MSSGMKTMYFPFFLLHIFLYSFFLFTSKVIEEQMPNTLETNEEKSVRKENRFLNVCHTLNSRHYRL